METKGKQNLKFLSNKWLQDLAFMADITEHLNNLNKSLQGSKKIVTQYCESINSFKIKLNLWETQLSKSDLSHFPCLKEICKTSHIFSLDSYKGKLRELFQEFEQRFKVFDDLNLEFSVFCSPFTVKPAELPVDIQLEVIDLQCDSNLREKFSSVGLDSFYQFLLPDYPNLTTLAGKILSMFGTTYLCEQVFSVMNINKNKLRSRLSNKHLNDILKLTAAQNIEPDIDSLVKSKRSQVSGS